MATGEMPDRLGLSDVQEVAELAVECDRIKGHVPRGRSERHFTEVDVIVHDVKVDPDEREVLGQRLRCPQHVFEPRRLGWTGSGSQERSKMMRRNRTPLSMNTWMMRATPFNTKTL